MSKEWRATAGSGVLFRAHPPRPPSWSGGEASKASRSIAKCVVDLVYAGLSFCVPAARSHPISRLRHHRSVECCLAHRVYAYLGCSQTNDSPEEVRGFCTDPEERAGSSVGSSLDERERVLDTQIELAGVDVALHLLSGVPDRLPKRARVGPMSSRA